MKKWNYIFNESLATVADCYRSSASNHSNCHTNCTMRKPNLSGDEGATQSESASSPSQSLDEIVISVRPSTQEWTMQLQSAIRRACEKAKILGYYEGKAQYEKSIEELKHRLIEAQADKERLMDVIDYVLQSSLEHGPEAICECLDKLQEVIDEARKK